MVLMPRGRVPISDTAFCGKGADGLLQIVAHKAKGEATYFTEPIE
jgi:hypothetical protein